MAALLLFAAVLVLGAPSAEAALPRPADVVALNAASHGPETSAAIRLGTDHVAAAGIDAPDNTPRLGFAEELCLLEPDHAQAGFGLFERGTRRCERTYARNNPLKYVDPDGMAPNQAGATSARAIRDTIRAYEKQGLRGDAVLRRLEQEHAGNSSRYFFTAKYGWVDVRHFAFFASMASRTGSALAQAAGVANEAWQAWNEATTSSNYRSGFSVEDIPSNAAGAEFGSDYLERAGSVFAAFMLWLADAGQLTESEEADMRSILPATDPARLGSRDQGRNRSNTTSAPGGWPGNSVNDGAAKSVKVCNNDGCHFEIR